MQTKQIKKIVNSWWGGYFSIFSGIFSNDAYPSLLGHVVETTKVFIILQCAFPCNVPFLIVSFSCSINDKNLLYSRKDQVSFVVYIYIIMMASTQSVGDLVRYMHLFQFIKCARY